MWGFNDFFDDEIEKAKKEIFLKYKYALIHIGVDFSLENVQKALDDSFEGMESALQTTISYWLWKRSQNQVLEHPNAFLIAALVNQWKPYQWKDEYLNNPNFKSPGLIWWEEAALIWGKDVRNSLVLDIADTPSGSESIVFVSGKRLPLRNAKVLGWERVLKYAREE